MVKKPAKTKEIQRVNAQTVSESETKTVLPVMIDGQTLSAIFREFSTGSKGWNVNGKIVVDDLRCQVTGNIIIIGSKPASK